ncbi:MAG TPA: hypothetical protein VFR81_06510 [Longimicrobium sp.]|nr:hypothetical protein [Longimicrobium sp.]
MDGIVISFRLTPAVIALALVYDAVLIAAAVAAVRRLRRRLAVGA